LKEIKIEVNNVKEDFTTMPFITLKNADGSTEQIEWTPYAPIKRKFIFKRAKKETNMNPYSIDDEAIAILKEWYVLRGLPVPPEEIEACRSAPVAEPPVEVAPPPAKLEYGTPEFWKDWWKRKKEKEAKAQAAAAALLAKAQAEFAALQLKEASSR
jgi:hypothetical protein